MMTARLTATDAQPCALERSRPATQVPAGISREVLLARVGPRRYHDARMNPPEPRIEYELLQDAALATFIVSETVISPTFGDDDKHVRIEGRFGPEGDDEDGEPGSDVEHYAFGLIFALGVLSFADARPRGVSGIDYRDDDDWTVGDMLRRLRFERGELHFYADYVRGRCLKTTVVVRKDGAFLLDTVNRGESATRWIAKLQGKKILSVVAEPSGT